jgi:hypothetical protein
MNMLGIVMNVTQIEKVFIYLIYVAIVMITENQNVFQILHLHQILSINVKFMEYVEYVIIRHAVHYIGFHWRYNKYILALHICIIPKIS